MVMVRLTNSLNIAMTPRATEYPRLKISTATASPINIGLNPLKRPASLTHGIQYLGSFNASRIALYKINVERRCLNFPILSILCSIDVLGRGFRRI